MTAYDQYILVLCLIVFIALTAMFAFLISSIVKMRLNMIKGGLVDNEISQKEQQEKAKHTNLAARFIINKLLPTFFCVLLVIVFGLSIGSRLGGTKPVGDTPIVKVVKSGSMASVYEKNTYIQENHLSNQIQKYDLIVIHKLPQEENLKLYDIVIYEVDGYLIMHRIVKIEEPNVEHSERYFLLQGDANQYPDRFPVKYSQMRGIYANQRIPYVGSFVDFMSSPAGYLCVLLIVFVMIISPRIEKRIHREMDDRKRIITLHEKEKGLSFSFGMFSKSLVADYMEHHFPNTMIVKRGKNTTKNGLSLPDTYYARLGNKNKCFAYVYCTKMGHAVIRIIGNEEIANQFEGMKKTLFPKRINEQWYVIDFENISESSSEQMARILVSSYQKVICQENGEGCI